MPYANNDGVRIYYEVEGQGPPLALAHGGTQNLNLWRGMGLTRALGDTHQLILFDIRGHGRSDKPHEKSSYGTKVADDVVGILDDLGIAKAHFMGYSSGALIGFMLAKAYPQRFFSFILGGMSPYGFPEAMVKMTQEAAEPFRLLSSDPDEAARRREKLFGITFTQDQKNAFLANDGEAMVAMLEAQFDVARLTDEDLEVISQPCLVICGELDPFHDGAKKAASHLPNGQFVSLAGLNHMTAFSPPVVLPHIKEFLARVSRA